MKKPVICLVATERTSSQTLASLLREGGYEVRITASLNTVHHLITYARPDLVLLHTGEDNPWTMIDVLHQIRRTAPQLPTILVTGHSTDDLAVAAFRAGITDYLKPSAVSAELLSCVQRCLPGRPPQPASPVRPAPPAPHTAVPSLIGASAVMQDIQAYILKVAATESNVLITGETGTGKELVAERIHAQSARQHAPFICVNCAALPENLVESELFGYERGAFTGAHTAKRGLLRQAHAGTLFFDEIGDMSLYTQAKILRAIERKEVQPVGGTRGIAVNLRIVAATNQPLDRLVAEEKFRADLFFRLHVARIHLPPLRDRKEDILSLCAHFLAEFNQRFGCHVEGLAPETAELFLRYPWPGNVRELRHLLEATFINHPSRHITVLDLPEVFRQRCQETVGFLWDERERVLSALFATNWNKSKAAAKLRWSRMTLYRKMVKYQLAD